MIAEGRRRPHAASSGRRGEAIEFRALFLASFAVLLVIETASRLVPRLGAVAARRSIFEEARAAAYRIVPLAFMG